MTTVFVTGNAGDDTVGELIKNTLSGTYRITYITGERVSVCGAGYEILCVDCVRPEISGAENIVMLAKREAVLPEMIPDGCTVIIDHDNAAQVEAVRKCGAFAVDCGVSPTSTVSFSSENETTVVISLNRAIKALSGRTIQPLEIPVEKRGADNYSLMSFTALRLLLDDFDSELGELICE